MFHQRSFSLLFIFAGVLTCPLITLGAFDEYSKLAERIRALTHGQKVVLLNINESGHTFPMMAIVSPPLTQRDTTHLQNVFLTGAVHGDEPAGTYALLEFLEKRARRYTDRFRFFVIPCVNPSGFTQNRAENSGGANINRSFLISTDVPEAKAIIKQLKIWEQHFLFTMDMHEIPPNWEGEGWLKKDNPHSAYLYETQSNLRKRIGRKMMRALPAHIEVCDWKTIYGDKAIRGLVSYPEGGLNQVYAAGTTMDGFLVGRYSDHTFTNETPTGWPLKKRVEAQLSWLETALALIRY